MNLKIKLTSLLLMLLSISFYAQDSYLIKGVVSSQSDNSPLPGVSVIIVNTVKGTDTDFDGNYSLKVSKGDVLQFSSIGFKNKSVTVTGQSIANISLEEDANILDEVVVVGYGTTKKSHLTGSISKVTNEDLDQIAVARVDEALVGQVSGVNIQATDGQAGAAPTITIRGVGSVSGDSTPLIVVDGVIVDGDFLGSLNMNDVESFEVLKDAASASIFGSKGSNGVIMITMKSGVEGTVKINYSAYTGIKTGRKIDAFDTNLADWAAFQLEETGGLEDFTRAQLQISEATGTDRTWQDVFVGQGTITSHALSFRGGTKDVKYAISANYTNDEGVLLVDNFRKYGARAKVDFKVNKKLKMGVNISPSVTLRKRFPEGLTGVSRQKPWIPFYHTEESLQFVAQDSEGNYVGANGNVTVGDYVTGNDFTIWDSDGDGIFDDTLGSNIANTSNPNPLAQIVERERTNRKFKLLSSVYAKYKINENFNTRSSLAITLQDTDRKDYHGTLAGTTVDQAYIEEIAQSDQYYILENVLNFNKEYGNHELGAVVGNVIERRDYQYSLARATGFENDLIKEISAAPSPSDIQGFDWAKRGISYFGRVNYAFDDKYLASLSFRRDGSSIFGSDFKYGNFPAASVGWNVHKEDFLSGSDFISNLKLRASYGVTGNDRLNVGGVDPDAVNNNAVSSGDVLVDFYPSLGLLSSTSASIDGQVISGVNSVNIENTQLQWERLIEINPGIDFGLFGNVVSGSVDWYRRTSDQLLLNNPVSVTTGFGTALQNLGTVRNEGWEFELRTKNVNKEKFKWNSTLLVTTNKNTLVDFGESNGQISFNEDESNRPAEYLNLEGNPITSYYGYVVDRILTLEETSLTSNGTYRHVGQESGLAFAKDLNGDGVLDNDDKTILGNPYPALIWSLSNQFTFGNLDFSFMFQGSHGAEVRNTLKFNSQDHNIARAPNLAFVENTEFVVNRFETNDFIEDASYIALRNVNLGYNISNDFTDNIGVSKFRVYVAGQNLLYFTADDYTGFNPEGLRKTLPTQYGFQQGGSPIASTISLGVNIDF